MKVLVVDDEQAILKMYSEAFKLRKIDVITAKNGEEGLRLITSEQPDIVLLDIIMPRLNGLDILAKMKADPALKSIPIYLLTNLPQECSEEKALKLGAAGYFVKAQTEPKALAEMIQKAFV